jgi:predicted N-acetyltransferase YhbS
MGIGKALIQEGLSPLKDLDAKGCCLVGHPQYYRKFGFENVAGLVHGAFQKRCFSLFRLTAAFRRAMSRSMKDSKRMANNKRMQGTRLRRAPDAQRYMRQILNKYEV